MDGVIPFSSFEFNNFKVHIVVIVLCYGEVMKNKCEPRGGRCSLFIAHIRESDHEIQMVQNHIEGVAWLAQKYGEPVVLAAHAELAGFLHDMGKYTEAFTIYIRNAVLYDYVSSAKIDHSTAGAKYLYENYYGKDPLQNLVIETVGMAILSHHSGLQNFIQT